MQQIKFDWFMFYREPTNLSPEEFLEENIAYYTKQWIDKNPELAYKVNDWETSLIYDDIDMDDVRGDMEECYSINLQNNYNV